MKNVDLVILSPLFKVLEVSVDQLKCYIDNSEEFRISGSVSSKKKMPEGYVMIVKANLCDKDGGILYALRDYFGFSFEMLEYDVFSMNCADLSRFFDLEDLHHVELYPRLKKKDE